MKHAPASSRSSRFSLGQQVVRWVGLPLLLPALALAQGADECANAQVVLGPGPHAVDLIGSTNSGAFSGTCPDHDNDVWFSWTAQMSGVHSFELCGSIVGWTASVHEGCGGQAVVCRYFNCQYDDNRLLFQAVAGVAYQFQVSSPLSTASGQFRIGPFVAAPNDTCTQALPLSTFGTFGFDLNQATGGGSGQTGCFNVVNDLWYEWVAPYSAYTTISTLEPFTYVGLFDGCGGAELACNTFNVLQGDAHIGFQAVAGQSYLLRIGSVTTETRPLAEMSILPSTPTIFSGNGHAYVRVGESLDWDAASAFAQQMNFQGVSGHLATFADAAENGFLLSLGSAVGWIGLYQDTTDPGFFEPSGGWKWVTGELVNFTNWGQPHQPDNDPLFSQGPENHAKMFALGTWADIENYANPFFVEWDLQSVGVAFCDPAGENSIGLATKLDAQVSTTSVTGVRLEAYDGPFGEFGYMLVGTDSSEPGIVIGQSRFCLSLSGGNAIGRYNVATSAMNSLGRFDEVGAFQNLVGTSSVSSGFEVPSDIPISGMGLISAGQTWHFQLMHREPSGLFNFSNGLSVTF